MSEEHRKTDEIILTKLDGIEKLWGEKFDRISEYMDDQKKVNESVTGRLSVVELAQANQMGKIAVISVAIGAAVTFALNWTMQHLRP